MRAPGPDEGSLWIATAAECRERDRRATAEFGIPADRLMENAGLAVFAALSEMAGKASRIAVLCGRGNNGGDGLVVARLAHAGGYDARCVMAAAHESELTELSRQKLELARAQGLKVEMLSDPATAADGLRLQLEGCQLAVDALLGTGAKDHPSGAIAKSIEALNECSAPVLAVDVPSGIECDTGKELGISVRAARTITFGWPKRFLFQGKGVEHSGRWSVAAIGYPRKLLDEPTDARLFAADEARRLLPKRKRSSHKGANGHVLILAGSRQMPGAASLAALGALRSGAGLVTVASIDTVCDAVAANVPEALLLRLPSAGTAIAPAAADIVLDVSSRWDTAVFGPGLTHDPPALELLGRLFAAWRTPCVIDADAINALALGVKMPSAAEAVLTPHPGEMARLLATTTEAIQDDRFESANQAARSLKRCVLLKGAYSISSSPEGLMAVNVTGNPGMATGGSGDVLSGVIATLLAQKLKAHEASALGAYWHGLAGDLCAAQIGSVGFLPSDLAAILPAARAKIGSTCDSA